MKKKFPGIGQNVAEIYDKRAHFQCLWACGPITVRFLYTQFNGNIEFRKRFKSRQNYFPNGTKITNLNL